MLLYPVVFVLYVWHGSKHPFALEPRRELALAGQRGGVQTFKVTDYFSVVAVSDCFLNALDKQRRVALFFAGYAYAGGRRLL